MGINATTQNMNDPLVLTDAGKRAAEFASAWLREYGPVTTGVTLDYSPLHALENKGLNLFPEGTAGDVTPFPLPIFMDTPDPNRAFDPSETEVAQQQLREKEQAIRAELTGKYNAVVFRFAKGLGTDIAAPDKASFRYISRARGIR